MRSYSILLLSRPAKTPHTHFLSFVKCFFTGKFLRFSPLTFPSVHHSFISHSSFVHLLFYSIFSPFIQPIHLIHPPISSSFSLLSSHLHLLIYPSSSSFSSSSSSSSSSLRPLIPKPLFVKIFVLGANPRPAAPHLLTPSPVARAADHRPEKARKRPQKGEPARQKSNKSSILFDFQAEKPPKVCKCALRSRATSRRYNQIIWLYQNAEIRTFYIISFWWRLTPPHPLSHST